MLDQKTRMPSFLDYFDTSFRSRTPKKHVSVEQVYATIQRDLQKLLSTRMRYLQTEPQTTKESKETITHSLLNYGMPDFMDLQFGSKEGQTQLCQRIQKTITHFEPRLKNIEVKLLEQREDYGVLKLRILAELNIPPFDQTVIYDSAYHPLQARFSMDAQ